MDHIICCLFVLGATSLTHACPKYCVCQNLSESLGTLCPSKGILFVPPDIDRSTVELRLGGNYILRITQQDFANMTNLVDLTLSRNTISYIQPFSFADLELLNSLHLDNNRLMELGPDDLQGLVNLQHLIMNNNQLGHIHGKTFEDVAPALEDLDLSYNNLISLPWDSVRHMINLHQLSLDHNLLDFIPEGTFTDLERLARLDLTSNRLQKLPPDPIFARTQESIVLTTPYAPQLSLSLGGNPLHCNCELLWLRRLERYDDLETCASPPSLKGRYFWNVKEEELICQPPLIAQHTQRILVLEGQTASLRCQAVGDPNPTIHWISPDDQLLGNSSRNVVHNNGTLSIVITTTKDYGTFTCIATNVAGESTASVEVSIVQLPHLNNGTSQLPHPNSHLLNITGLPRISNRASVSQREEAVSVSEVTTVSALIKWTLSKSAPKVKMYQLQYNCSDDEVLIYRMIPASSQAFLLTNLVSGTRYDLCVLAAWDDLATTLTATSLVGCTDLYTQGDYFKCQSLSSQLLGGTTILAMGGMVAGALLLIIIVLLVRYKGTCSETPVGMLMNFFDKHSKSNGRQFRQNELFISSQLEPVVKPKVSLQDTLECGSLQSSISSSSSSDSLVRGSYNPKRTLVQLWGPAPSKPPESNLAHLLGAFTSLERQTAQEYDPQASSSISVSTEISHTGRELLLAQTLDSGLRRLLMLPLESKMKRSQSFDIRDATVSSAAQLGNATHRISGIWTKRSVSVNGLLLPWEETEDRRGSEATVDSSDWVMESTV